MKLLISALFVYIVYFAQAGEISDNYFQQAKENRKHETNGVVSTQVKQLRSEAGMTNCGITEIGIERTACYGTCPSYTFIIKANGTFRYQGEMYVERKGTYTGTVSPWAFNQLARFICESGYMDFSNEYTANITDNPTVYTSVVLKGRRKIISNYAGAGPVKLWAVEQLIDQMMTKAKWDRPKAENKPKEKNEPKRPTN